MREHAVQDRRRQFLRARRPGVAIEERLGFDHEGAEPLRVARLERGPGLGDDALVDGPEQVLHAAFERPVRERVRPVQTFQDLQRVLGGVQVHDHEVQVPRRPDLLGAEAFAVELHEHGPAAERAPLVHAPAARGRRDLALVRQLHLAPDREFEIVDAVERACGEHRDGRARRQPALDRQVGARVVDREAPDAIVGEHLVGHAGRVAEEAPLPGLLEQRLRLERDLARADRPAVGRRGGEDERGRVRLHLRVDALVRPADQGVPLLDVRVDAPVAAGPVRVLAEQAHPPGNEDVHALTVTPSGTDRRPSSPQRRSRSWSAGTPWNREPGRRCRARARPWICRPPRSRASPLERAPAYASW